MAQQGPFREILERGLRERKIPNLTQDARNWYRQQAMEYQTTPTQLMLNTPLTQLKAMPKMGNMYMYWYDPKHKKTLPLYDMFPCIILYKFTNDGFYGLNLHYLDLRRRAFFFDQLYQYVNNTTTYDEKTRFMLTYNLLKNTANLSFFRNCIKRYLTSHVTSRFLLVPPESWDTAMFLPVAQWNDMNESRKQNLRPYKGHK